MAAKECPMCGETMTLRKRTITDRVPGTTQTQITTQYEWVCPDCDYFEEGEDLKG